MKNKTNIEISATTFGPQEIVILLVAKVCRNVNSLTVQLNLNRHPHVKNITNVWQSFNRVLIKIHCLPRPNNFFSLVFSLGFAPQLPSLGGDNSTNLL